MALSRYQRQQQRYFKEKLYDSQKNKIADRHIQKTIDEAIKDGKSPFEIQKIIAAETKKIEQREKKTAKAKATKSKAAKPKDAVKEKGRYQRQQQRYFKKRVYDVQKDKKFTNKRIQKAVDRAIKEGKNPLEIQKVIAKETKKSENYAKTAARTDATRLENMARERAYQQIWELGVMLAKEWQTTLDGRQRDSHNAMNHEQQFIDDAFSNGGMYPGDPDLPDKERYNCRCRTLPIVLDEYKLTEEDRRYYNYRISYLNARVMKELGF